jgi:hypothetical protein
MVNVGSIPTLTTRGHQNICEQDASGLAFKTTDEA